MMLDRPICENVFQKVWTLLLQSLGFERVKISFYCTTQWKVARPRLRSERRATQHLAWSSFASMKMESAAPQTPPANIRKEEILWIVVTNWYWERSRLPIATRCWWCLDIKNMLEQAWKDTSGGFKFSRKCCNGLTNRHLASGHIMTMKR